MLQKADAFVDPKRDLSSNSSMNQPIKRIETSISCTKVRLCTEVDQIKRVLPKIEAVRNLFSLFPYFEAVPPTRGKREVCGTDSWEKRSV
jgi:hypothetical protein